jgi:hypothetical protein
MKRICGWSHDSRLVDAGRLASLETVAASWLKAEQLEAPSFAFLRGTIGVRTNRLEMDDIWISGTMAKLDKRRC